MSKDQKPDFDNKCRSTSKANEERIVWARKVLLRELDNDDARNRKCKYKPNEA